MSEYSDFFLNSSGSIIQLECLEIRHPNFTKTYRIVRNDRLGVVVRYEDGVDYAHDYYPMKITSMGNRGDLDAGLEIIWGDLGEIIPVELDSVSRANGFLTKPVVKYRTFRSDDHDKVLFGPLVLQITTFTFNKDGATFQAAAPRLNIQKTGEIYDLARFPMLQGYV